MEAVFLKLLNVSMTASYLVLAVILIRLLFKKAPKWANCLLWGVVALRLVFLFNIESIFSLIPNAQPIPQDILFSKAPAVDTGVAALDQVINPILAATSTPALSDSITPLQVATFVATWIWIAGMAIMAVYALVSYVRIRWQVRESARLCDNVWVSDRIDSPFILGLLRPRIYLPHDLSEADAQYVLQHEKAHLKRLDHIWKPLGFALLTVYWFNPLLWVAYILLCRDIEMACDEKVLRQMGAGSKKPYAEALINCSVPRKSIAACPLAFGEGDVKKRIRSILNYKKPAFWVIIAAVVICICVSVAFLTSPKTVVAGISDQRSGASLHGISMRVSAADLTSSDPYIEVELENNSLKTIICSPHIQVHRQENGQWQRFATQVSSEDPVTLAPGQILVHRISLLCRDFSSDGRYRFEIAFYPAGKQIEDESQLDNTWVDFTLEADISNISVTYLRPSQRICRDDSLARSTALKNIPDYRLVSSSSGLWLHTVTEDGAVVLGKLQEMDLTADKFAARFIDPIWAEGHSLDELKCTYPKVYDSHYYIDPHTGRKLPYAMMMTQSSFVYAVSRAWELYYPNPETGEKELYVVLQKPDGTIYLCFGYYGHSEDLPNPDNSYFTGVYSMNATPDFAGGITTYIVG